MPRDPKYDVLFEPIEIGPKTMPNRFYKPPHCCNFGADRPGDQAYLRSVAAEGGWGAVNTEYCSIHPESDAAPHIGARLWDDADMRNLALMCERAHEHGALAGVQLWYGAAHAPNYETRLVPRGVSQITSDFAPFQSCSAMSKREIRELQGFHVTAAKRARSAGFDLVNVYGGHTHPITHQFLEPFYNKRTDEYGGSFENRARFWRETIELVKEAVGDDCSIVCRFGVDTLREDDGISATDDGAAFVQLVDPLVDLWDFVVGHLEWGEDASPSRFLPEDHQRSWIDAVRPFTTKPVVGVGRFTSADTMVDAIRSGRLDIIGAARPSIADPFLPRKIEEGRLDDIVKCIGCNVCISRIQVSARLICTQNATSGEEYRRGWHPESFSTARNRDNDVLVVGAGPAGMECAVVLGRRNMRQVHLVEAHAEPGGSMRWIPELPGLDEWGRVIDYRKDQLDKLTNVDVVANATLDVGDVTDYGAQIVIIATGSTWATDGLNGVSHDAIPGADASKPTVLTPEQIMVEGKGAPGETVLVYDCDGYFMGVSLAEKLAREGKQVTLVTPLTQVAPYTELTLELPRIRRTLLGLGVRLLSQQEVTGIEPGRVTGCDVHAVEQTSDWSADSVVLVTQRVSNERLFRELQEEERALRDKGVSGLYRIGDCVAPRLVADVIFDGHRLAREIDTENPAEALPFIREHRMLGARDEDYDGILRADAGNDRPRSSLDRLPTLST